MFAHVLSIVPSFIVGLQAFVGIIKLVNIQENVSLTDHSTMRLGGAARYLAQIDNEDQIPELATWAREQRLPIITVGRGSNIIWRDEGFSGLVIVNKILGKEVLSEDAESATLRLASGENWDEAVAWTVDKGLSGIEFLSLIPGTVGGAPVQNIGAYGGELSSTLLEVNAYDTKEESFGSMLTSSCGLGYRTSRFKGADHGRFIITGIVLRLSKKRTQGPFYESLQAYFDEHGIAEYSPKNIRAAVIAIRTSKMPDPEKVSNNGSFFTNPIVDSEHFARLQQQYPDIKGWPYEDKIKIAAGWLVEKAGFRGVRDEQTGMATWSAQALVLVNEHAKNTADLLAFKQKIVDKVQAMFGVALEQEPELLP